jgi:hypothetical protein
MLALLVAIKPSGCIWVCLGAKTLSEALELAQYYMMTVDNVLPQLSNAGAVDFNGGISNSKPRAVSRRLTTA